MDDGDARAEGVAEGPGTACDGAGYARSGLLVGVGEPSAAESGVGGVNVAVAADEVWAGTVALGVAPGLGVGTGRGFGLTVGRGVGVGLGALVGASVEAARTTTTPVICSGWTSQKYG